MLFSYIIFFSLFITFSFAAPAYVPRDQAFLDWKKLLSEDGGVWKPSSASKVPTKITQLIWSTNESAMKVEIHYSSGATISAVSQDLDPVTAPGADLATGAIWVQAGPAVAKPREIQIVSVSDDYWKDNFFQICGDPKNFFNPNIPKPGKGQGQNGLVALFGKAKVWFKKHL